jgi:hypothetical protein
MRWIVAHLARLFGTTLEDWLLAVMMVVVLALTVGGVRSCTHEQFEETRTQSHDSR